MTVIEPQALGALAGAHQLLLQLVENLSPPDCNRRFEPDLPSAGWLLGRSVYLELHLLRGVVLGDDDLAARVRHLFEDDAPRDGVDARLPARDHLLNWAVDALEQHLVWLANPGQLPAHELLEDSWLVWHLAQRHALHYERLLAVLTARSARDHRGDYHVERVLRPVRPSDDTRRIEQGLYRIGARDGAVMANERPPQMVELHAFRISRRPVSNAEYLAFMQDGGYRANDLWDTAGQAWRAAAQAQAPWNWYQDAAGNWYDVGIHGPADLVPDDPVVGLSGHEARAFAAWAAASGPDLAGAVPQHEYQWEVASRLGEIEGQGRSWEWCANTFHHYPAYRVPADPMLDPCPTDDTVLVLRGACLHTQPTLRRTTFRHCAPAERRTLFAGTRLVVPPGKAVWQ